MRLEAELDQLRVLGIVVVLFGLNPGIGKVTDFHPQSQLLGGGLHQVRQLQNRKLFGELVENAEFAFERGVQTSDFNAANRVANIQKSSGLAALPVNRKRLPGYRLHTKPIQDRSENFVIVKAVDQHLIERHLVGHGSKYHTLIQVRRTQPPGPAGEHDVVAVMHFGKVIEGAGLFGIGKNIAAAIVLDGEVAFFDIDIGRAVLPHGS